MASWEFRIGCGSAVGTFQIYEGNGEWFDLSKKPIERATCSFGGAEDMDERYLVTEKCNGCKQCISECPQGCITIEDGNVIIRQKSCIRCGHCFETCPAGAIEKRES